MSILHITAYDTPETLPRITNLLRRKLVILKQLHTSPSEFQAGILTIKLEIENPLSIMIIPLLEKILEIQEVREG